MQAALAPLLAGGAAAGTAATITPLALAASAAGPIFTGLAGHAAAKGEQQRAKINSYIGRTRALETDTNARQGLESELGSMRAALAANNQTPGVGTLAVMRELRDARGRERRIRYGNEMQSSADWKLAGRNAGAQANAALFTGLAKAGPSLFDLYDYYSNG